MSGVRGESGAVLPVGIVGGGPAGLVCAEALSRAGLPFVLWEAADRLGGRAGTLRDGDSVLDLGPKGFPRGGAVHALATGLGLAGQLTGMPGGQAVALHPGGARGADGGAGTVVCDRRGVHGGGLTPRQSALATHHLLRAAGRSGTGPGTGGPAGSWADEVALRCGEGLLRRVFDPLAHALTLTPAGRLPAGAAYRALSRVTAPLMRLTGGFQELIDALVARLGEAGAAPRLLTGHRVVAWRRGGAGHTVDVRGPLGRLATVEVRELVLAVPEGPPAGVGALRDPADGAGAAGPGGGPEGDRDPVAGGDAGPRLGYRRVRQVVLRGTPRPRFAAYPVNLWAGPSLFLAVRIGERHWAVLVPEPEGGGPAPDARWEAAVAAAVECFAGPGVAADSRRADADTGMRTGGMCEVPVPGPWRGPLRYLPLLSTEPHGAPEGIVRIGEGAFRCGDSASISGVEAAVDSAVSVSAAIVHGRIGTTSHGASCRPGWRAG